MKIRTDFVTNSSSSSFMAITAKSSKLRKMLNLYDSDELNELINNAIEESESDYPLPFTNEFSSISEYLIALLQYEGEIEEDMEFSFSRPLVDGDIQAIEINHAEFDDSSFGPFEYVKISKKKKLTIFVDEDYDDNAYKNESISNMEFYIIGAQDEFERYDEIVKYITDNGGFLSEQLTEKSRYAVCANFSKYESKIKKARSSCVPVLSENAFVFRYLDSNPYDNIYDLAYEIENSSEFSTEDSVLKWFEKYGFGETNIEYWEGNKWVKQKATDITCDWLSEKIFVITGFDDKEEKRYTEIIERLGGIVKSSTVLKTDYLIFNPDYDHETTKLKRAKELIEKGKNICIITGEAFEKSLEDNNPPVKN